MKSLEGFQLVEAGTPSKHVGRVIVDWVLQVGHDYEGRVRRAVQLILQQEQADTISGFIELIENRRLADIINFKTNNTKTVLLSAARFFQRNGVNTFDELYVWLESEENRNNLLTVNSGLKGSVFRVADKTADYIRVLVGHWDAVAVDKGIHGLLARMLRLPKSRKSKKWPYKEKRTIVQLAALHLGCTPRDLDRSLYRHYVEVKTTI